MRTARRVRSAAEAVDGPLVVVSTHLDDAVLSCGQLLAAHPGSTVVTVFAGLPGGASGAWDHRTTGLAEGAAAVAARRREDERALQRLDCRPVWLGLLDGQYTPGVPAGRRVDAVASALEAALAESPGRTMLAPLGLEHPDHAVVALACARLSRTGGSWWLYEDVPYRQHASLLASVRRTWKGLPDHRRQALTALRPHVTLGAPMPVRGDVERKLEALEHYRTQTPALAEGRTRYASDVRAAEVLRPVLR